MSLIVKSISLMKYIVESGDSQLCRHIKNILDGVKYENQTLFKRQHIRQILIYDLRAKTLRSTQI